MNKILSKTFLLSMLSLTFLANASIQSIRTDIQDLAREIAFSVNESELDLEALHQIRSQMEVIVAKLKDGGAPQDPPVDFNQCVDFAFSKYNDSYSSNAAMDMAVKACRTIKDLDVAKFVFEKSYLTYSKAGSMDMATKYAQTNMQGKLEILDFAYYAYEKNLSAGASIVQAAENAALAKRDALECLRFSYNRRYQNLNSSAAMNAAFKDCQ